VADSVLEEERVVLKVTEDGDHDTFSHYAKKDDIGWALVEGLPIRALCGKLWVPNKDPNKYPVCPACKEIWESISE